MFLNKICDKLNIPDCERFKWSFWIFCVSLISILIIILICKEKFFYETSVISLNSIYRFLWVLPFLFMGFSFLALLVAKGGNSKNDPPLLSYVFSYFSRLFALSLIIFSVLHLFESTSGYLYYSFSAGLGLYLGYNIDWIKLEDILKNK